MRVTRLRLAVTAVVGAAGLTVASGVAAVAGTGGTGGSGPARITIGGSPSGTQGAPGSAAKPTASRSQPARPVTVTLPTGDRVRVDPAAGGQPTITPEPAAGTKPAPASFVRFSSGGDQYVVPDPAVPYLHSTLDPRLFDVGYLARAKLASTPVKITYASAQATAALPGVRVTHRSGTTASATIAPATAAQFGQKLASQWRSARTGQSTAATGQLPGIAHISLVRAAGAPPLPPAPAQQIQPQAQAQAQTQASAQVQTQAAARVQAPAQTQPQQVQPQAAQGSGLPFYTLTVNLTDLKGISGVGVGWVQNNDDAGMALDVFSAGGITPAGAVQGPVSVAVPKGTYSLVFSILTPHGSDSGFDSALVVKPQVTVNSDTTVSLDARTAVPFNSSVPSASAPVRVDQLNVTRDSAAGGGLDTAAPGSFINLFMGLISVTPGTLFPGLLPSKLLATPTAAPKQGVFGFDASTQLWPSIDAFNGSETTQPTYLLDFPTADRIPDSLQYTVPAERLTTVHSQIYDTPSNSCPDPERLLQAQMYHPWGTRQVLLFAVPAGSRTDYLYTSAPSLSTFEPALLAADCTVRIGARRQISQGGQVSETWNKGPLVPSPASPPVQNNTLGVLGPGSTVTDPALVACTACRQDNNAVTFVSPFGDSDPSHYWDAGNALAIPPSEFRFFRNSTLSFDSSSFNLSALGGMTPMGFDLPLLPGAVTYRLDWTQNNAIDQAASNETDWTFHSSSADAPAKLPSTVQCPPDPSRACSFLPLLFIRYDLALNFSNQATAGGPEAINFTVGGQQNAPAPSGVTATVSASFDDGKTWTSPAPATSLGNGKFSASIDQPPLASTSGFVSLRVHAQDAAGNAVDQTIIRAYGLTS